MYIGGHFHHSYTCSRDSPMSQNALVMLYEVFVLGHRVSGCPYKHNIMLLSCAHYGVTQGYSLLLA